jgi:hypothetical protein
VVGTVLTGSIVHPDALPSVFESLALNFIETFEMYWAVLDALRRDTESALAVTLDLAVYKKDVGRYVAKSELDRSLSSSS